MSQRKAWRLNRRLKPSVDDGLTSTGKPSSSAAARASAAETGYAVRGTGMPAASAASSWPRLVWIRESTSQRGNG